MPKRFAATFAVVSALVIVAPAMTASAVEPPPTASGQGTSGSVIFTPTLTEGESVTVTTSGLSRGVLLGESERPVNAGHSAVSIDVTEDPGYILISDEVWVENASMVRFETVVADPSVELEMEITWIEQGDLNVGGQWTVNTPGPVERLDERGYYGLWLVLVRQLSGPPGVFIDTTATVVKNAGLPLALSSSTVSTANPSITASWSGLAPDGTYLATVDWGSRERRTILEVTTGAAVPPRIATATTARLSSSINTRGTTYLITRVSAATGYSLRGELRLRVDGVVRSTQQVDGVSGMTFNLPVPALSRGVHEVKAEFLPAPGTLDPSNSPVRRLLVVR